MTFGERIPIISFMKLKQGMILTIEIYCQLRGISLVRASHMLFNRGTRIASLQDNSSVSLDTYERIMETLAKDWPDPSKWPQDVEWPEDVPKPAQLKTALAVAV
ncbi:MAG: hypothetical protein JKY49_03475 [Cohaesibacteraceae bacterium]|nr:hypothetical protein [Cohaesibacteraceae bacterium]